MDIEALRKLCKELPAVTKDDKRGNDLCFLIAKKMFCVCSLSTPLTASFKVRDDEFEELCNSDGIIPAPYVARYNGYWWKMFTVSARKSGSTTSGNRMNW